MEWMSTYKKEKEAFFRGLDLLDCETEDGDSEGEISRLMNASRQRKKKEEEEEVGGHVGPAVTSSHQRSETRLSRRSRTKGSGVPSVSLAASGSGTEQRRQSIAGEATSDASGNLEAASLKIIGGRSGAPTGHDASARKRKRGSSSGKDIPENQQIFKGLVFFFFPNSDVSPLRRLRIQRAQEYGAQWAKAWDDRITHIIVDKGLTFHEVLKHMNLQSLPPTMAMVDESYPAECIKFRFVLSTRQIRFHVNGAPTSYEGKEEPPTKSPAQLESLPLKPDRKQPQNTPPSSQISDSQGDAPGRVLSSQVNAPEDQSGDPLLPRERDALDDMIEAALAAKDLPLDGFDDETTIESSDIESSESDTELAQKKRKLLHEELAVVESWQQNFVCMQRHDANSDASNPNSRTIEVLQQMLDYYTRTSDQWRTLAYRKAISALRKQPERVVTRTQALSIPGIGTRLADKIEEIVFTNRLRRLENTNATAEDRILQEFLGVYGAGVSVASKWVAKGYKSLDDLLTKASLTQPQRIGVERYYDFSQRIPRREVELHGEIVRQAVQKEIPGMQVIIGGSYRRGAADSGDIDLIITKPDATIEQIRTIMIDRVVPRLFRQKFLQASLASTSRVDGSKWHGASKLPGSQVWRRIDLLFVPGSEIGAALIYFTGNDIFNRSMRLLASKKSMRLNQRGLYADVLRGPQRVKVNEGRLVESRDERRIFEILGVPWRPPQHRVC